MTQQLKNCSTSTTTITQSTGHFVYQSRQDIDSRSYRITTLLLQLRLMVIFGLLFFFCSENASYKLHFVVSLENLRFRAKTVFSKTFGPRFRELSKTKDISWSVRSEINKDRTRY